MWKQGKVENYVTPVYSTPINTGVNVQNKVARFYFSRLCTLPSVS